MRYWTRPSISKAVTRSSTRPGNSDEANNHDGEHGDKHSHGNSERCRRTAGPHSWAYRADPAQGVGYALIVEDVAEPGLRLVRHRRHGFTGVGATGFTGRRTTAAPSISAGATPAANAMRRLPARYNPAPRPTELAASHRRVESGSF